MTTATGGAGADGGQGSKGLLIAGGAFVAAVVAIPGGLVAATMIAVSTSSSTDSQDAMSSAALKAGAVPAQYAADVEAAGKHCAEISGPLIAAQIEQESGWNPNAVSPVGAQGIAQFMPGTWASVGKDYDHDGKALVTDPADAIGSEADYMCQTAAEMKAAVAKGTVRGDLIDLTLAAYNAGSGAVLAAGGVPPYAETQNYVKTIKAGMAAYADPASIGVTGGGDQNVVLAARKWIGLPYVWGGGGIDGPSGRGRDGRGPGFDCSGLVAYAIYHAYGIELDHLADTQIHDSRAAVVATKPAGAAPNFGGWQPGDVIGFSENGSGAPGSFGHIAIYAGGGHMVEAPRTGLNLRDYDLTTDTYWRASAWRIVRFHK